MNTQAASQQEMLTINEALQNIVDSLYTEIEVSEVASIDQVCKEAPGILKADPYREELLAVVLNRGAFWSWHLLVVPLDDDFIYLAYRVILGREPDQEGFSHFQSTLSVGTVSRVSVLRSLLLSPEVRDRNPPVAGKGLATFLYEVGNLFGKLPFVNPVIRAVWVMSTGQKRMRRTALLLQGLREELQGVREELRGVREELAEHRLKSEDTIEYFSNQNKRNLWRVQ